VKTIHATYEDGALRPTERLDLPAGAQVELFLREPQDDPIAVLKMRFPHSFGGLPNRDAEEMMQAIDEEFGRVDPDAWK
jgi:predicted DNA-binding antitoxin AbrB/MazE fold protein